MFRKIKPSAVLALILLVLVALVLVDNARSATLAKGPKPIVPSSNQFELVGNFVSPPLCVYVGDRQPYVFEIQNVGRRSVHAMIKPSGLMLGSPYGVSYSFARPSLRGSPSYNLHWPVTLMPGQKTRVQINLVVPDWVSNSQKGPVQFWFGMEVVIPGSTGLLLVTTVSEFCEPGLGSGK